MTAATRALVATILREARSRGVDLDEESVTVQGDLPVLRIRIGRRVLRTARIRLPGPPGSRGPDVVTVHGSGYLSSKTWPRKRDGSFALSAVVDHLLELVRGELEHARPDPPVASGVQAAASGIHVLHAAGILLGTITGDANPDALVERITDLTIRSRIDSHLRKGGLTDGDSESARDGTTALRRTLPEAGRHRPVRADKRRHLQRPPARSPRRLEGGAALRASPRAKWRSS